MYRFWIVLFLFFSCAQAPKSAQSSLALAMHHKKIGHKSLKEAMGDPEIKALVQSSVAGQDYEGLNRLYCYFGSLIRMAMLSGGSMFPDEETINKKIAESTAQCEGCVS